MEDLEIIKIKLNGIIGCVLKYTKEPYITNIIKELKVSLVEQNIKVIKYACLELFKWYKNNINKILSSVENKNFHIFIFLKSFIE